MRAVAELLAQYEDVSLLSELELWEAVRASMTAPGYAPPPHANARTFVVLDGIPGAGKSTAQKWLTPALGAQYFSMARFAEARGVTADERRQHQLATRGPHPVDEAFLETLAASSARYVLLEKFPRTVIEAAAMLRAAKQHGWRVEVLHLELPGDCVALSTQRQLERGPRHGRMPEPEYAQHRALVHLARATSGRETLRAGGMPIHAFDMTRPAEANAQAIRRALGLDFDELGWSRATLEVLARAAQRLGLDAWVTGGTLYRPFWNGRFGPAQRPTDVDVAVNEGRDVEPLLNELEREAPRERWSVLAPSQRLRERYGIETGTAAEAKAYATFMHRTGLVRMLRSGRVELSLPPGCEAALWSGTVALNPRSPNREAHHLPRALSDYPGLCVEPETAKLLGWSGHRPRSIATAWRTLKSAVTQVQRRGRQAFCRRALEPDEREIALQILQFHQESEFKPEAPPVPALSPVPPFTSLERLAGEAEDAAFAEWFLDQVHHHRPAGGADAYLQSVLDLSLFRPVLRELTREQSAMHQGWSLERHLAQSVLQLHTDEVRSSLEPRELRACMRMAMLFHDTGKLLGQRPQRHAQISARLFARFRPKWFPERLVKLTQWMIRTHDLFGAFGRGLTEKQGQQVAEYRRLNLSLATSYFGALDSQAVRAILLEPGLPLEEATAISRQIWSADIGSIAALRWLLPVAELVERLILIGQTQTVGRADRRKRL